MKTSLQTSHRGSALIIALFVIFLVATCIAIAMNLTTATVRQTDSSRDFSELRVATEGAVDFGYGIWTKTVNNYGPVTQTQLNAALGTQPSFSGFTYASNVNVSPVDSYGAPVAAPAPIPVNLPKYPGWIGKNYNYMASASLTGTTNGGRTIAYGAKRAINYSVVPLFQATAFFEDNLELYRTAPMEIGGLVHTNSTAYVSSSSTSNPSLTFTGNLSYVAGYSDDKAPPLAYLWSGYAPNSAFPPEYGDGASKHEVQRMEPLGTDPASVLHPPTDENGHSTGDKNPNDDSMRELIEPPDTSKFEDPAEIAQRRLYNKAGIIIKVSGNSYSVTTQNGTTLSKKQTDALKDSLSQQTIYDRREGKWMDVTSLDVEEATKKVKKESGALEDASFNNILYIYNDDSTYTDPKAVRITNGDVLPAAGLTVASENPVYVQGDYNTAKVTVDENGKPTTPSSAVFADAVTILSKVWNDGHSDDGLSQRKASDTTVNTAIVAGFLPSGWTNEFGAKYGYSGGLNNFPRFLEDWSNHTFTYNGSMIELFTSKIATGEWDTGNIYSPPDRNWNFDSNFIKNPPPGSLDAVTISRGSLARF